MPASLVRDGPWILSANERVTATRRPWGLAGRGADNGVIRL
jgi:hypothetical protein